MGEFIEKINANTFACKQVGFEKRHADEMRTDECWVGDVWNCVVFVLSSERGVSGGPIYWECCLFCL